MLKTSKKVVEQASQRSDGDLMSVADLWEVLNVKNHVECCGPVVKKKDVLEALWRQVLMKADEVLFVVLDLDSAIM